MANDAYIRGLCGGSNVCFNDFEKMEYDRGLGDRIRHDFEKKKQDDAIMRMDFEIEKQKKMEFETYLWKSEQQNRLGFRR